MIPFRVVGKKGVEDELHMLDYKGHDPVNYIRIIHFTNGRCAVGVLEYADFETVLLAEDKTYESCRTAFSAIGARFDAYFAEKRLRDYEEKRRLDKN